MSTPIDLALRGRPPEDSPNDLEVMSERATSKTEFDSRSEPKQLGLSELAPQATRYAMSIVRSWPDAEEIVQEAFCRLIQSDKRKPEPETRATSEARATPGSPIPKPLLFATVRNLSIDQLRRKQRVQFEPIDNGRIESRQSTSDDRLNALETGIQAIMKKLPTEWADALQLKINGELSYEEIASILAATHGQVRTWIYRARKELANELQRQGLLETE